MSKQEKEKMWFYWEN